MDKMRKSQGSEDTQVEVMTSGGGARVELPLDVLSRAGVASGDRLEVTVKRGQIRSDPRTAGYRGGAVIPPGREAESATFGGRARPGTRRG